MPHRWRRPANPGAAQLGRRSPRTFALAWQDWKQKEIAAVRGVSLGTVSQRLCLGQWDQCAMLPRPQRAVIGSLQNHPRGAPALQHSRTSIRGRGMMRLLLRLLHLNGSNCTISAATAGRNGIMNCGGRLCAMRLPMIPLPNNATRGISRWAQACGAA